MQGKFKASSSISVDNVSELSCWLKPVLLLHVLLPSSCRFKGTGNTQLLMEEFRMGWGQMVYKSWQGCWILAPSISVQEKLFCLRPASPVSMQGMDDACLLFLQIVSKSFRHFITGFLNLSCYISTCSANLETESMSDRSDESWLTPKNRLYFKGKNTTSLICFLQVFSILILNIFDKTE